MRDKQNKKVEGRELFGQKATQELQSRGQKAQVLSRSKSSILQSPFQTTEDSLRVALAEAVQDKKLHPETKTSSYFKVHELSL